MKYIHRYNRRLDYENNPKIYPDITVIEEGEAVLIINHDDYDAPERDIKKWIYNNEIITVPYSINRIDGHSSKYSRGTYGFETIIKLNSVKPTYLLFQHADQSAEIYVDGELVTTHWGGYIAFGVDLTNYVHKGKNRIKVKVTNSARDALAPSSGDFNFNATLGKVKLLFSPALPDLSYGYDGFHITSTVSNASATIYVKTTVPNGVSVVCNIDDETYHYTDTQTSDGTELTFTTTIQNPHLWNGKLDPHLYNVTIKTYKDNILYHTFTRPYGFRYYSYVYDETVNGVTYTGFLLNGQPYLLRGVCMHHDIEDKANALTDTDVAHDFEIIQELGCNFIRLVHYPHTPEVYDWCDRLGIIVETEAPCVNKFQSNITSDYYTHLEGQITDMVNQHYNHPCILFWGIGNEIQKDSESFSRTKINGYRTLIRTLRPESWVGYVVSHSISNGVSYMGNPTIDWIGHNYYSGWYVNQNSNDPTTGVTQRFNNVKTVPMGFSEYGCGGTQHCHSEDPQTTTDKGAKGARHDIEHMMWLHEGHVAAIKNMPQLLFTSQWQLFDVAVSSRDEGYTICLDGTNTSIDNNLRYLNDKGLVERDHTTKKDSFYLYKAWWNQTDKFVHICGKDYQKYTDRVIKCYTNDGNTLSLYVNNTLIESKSVTNNICEFTARNFSNNDVVKVSGSTTYDTWTI